MDDVQAKHSFIENFKTDFKSGYESSRKEVSSYSRRQIAFLGFITVMTIIAGQLVARPLYNLLKAEEVTIPAHLTALEYIDQIKAADANEDGVINLFDYAILESDYYSANTFAAADSNIDGQVNALDSSFLLANLAEEVEYIETSLMANPDIATAVTKEIAVKNETAFPTSPNSFADILADEGVSLSSDEGPSQGRNTIPTTLGTVSEYSGEGTFSFPFKLPKGPGDFQPNLGISYSSGTVDDSRNNGSHNGSPFYQDPDNYIPSQVGYGFSISGIGSIVRDTMKSKDLYKVDNEVHHRYILNLPGGIAAELKFNRDTGRWSSIPQSFLKIEHAPAGRKLQAGDHRILDGGEWEITTKDGTKYYFGEDSLGEKLEPNGRIVGSSDYLDKDGKHVAGTQGANFYMEFDTADLCTGKGSKCGKKEEDGEVLIATKWLLRRIESPDGKTIEYTYDTNQKKLQTQFDDRIDFITSTSYPREVRWNDDKHRVVFLQEEQPTKGKDEAYRNRIKEIRVETQREVDNKYHLVRKFDLKYFSENTGTAENLGVKAGEESKGIDNSWKASFLTSVQEFGTDGTTSLPPVTFKYKQYRFPPQNFGGGEIYLSQINNGLGGVTNFAYQAFESAVFETDGDYRGRLRRVRVIEQKVDDLTTNRSTRTTYSYGPDASYAPRYSSANAGPLAPQFLGHSFVEVKMYDFDGSLLAHRKSDYYQSIHEESCYEPHPAKGKTHTETKFDLLGRPLTVSRSSYIYRLAGQIVQGVETCQQERIQQPYFVYVGDSLSEIYEHGNVNFVPSSILEKLSIVPKKSTRTLQRNLEYDAFGNLTKAVSYAEVDENNQDINPDDNRYSFSYYLTDGAAWIKGLPFLSYSSDNPSCGPDDMTCQWGRTRTFYDNFDKDYRNLTWAEQQPKFGYPTQQESFIDEQTIVLTGTEYDRLDGTKLGGITKQYGPKPNIKTSSPENTILLSETKYDDYYHSLVIEKRNTLGHKIRTNEYNVLLQSPLSIQTQINELPERYSVSRVEYDAVGRVTASFGPDPENPGLTLDVPTEATYYFEQGDNGLVMRTASLTSMLSNGSYTYSFSDEHFDGLGNVRQLQTLSSLVEGTPQRTVTDVQYHADERSSEKYEIQLAEPINLPSLTAQNYASVMSQQPPQILSIPRRVIATVDYDEQLRPVAVTQIEPNSNSRFTTRTNYAVNGSQTVDAKGVRNISISDGLGRSVYSIIVDGTGSQSTITTNEYSQSMIDQPTKITITDGQEAVSTEYVYDRGGRILSIDDPSHGPSAFEYDVQGNVVLEKTQPREDVTFTYDELGRLVKKSYVSFAEGEMYKKVLRDSIEYTYDAGDNALGQIVKIEDLVGGETYTYDGGQRIISNSKTIFDKTQDFTTEYNKISQNIRSQFPGTNIEYTYDRDGALQNMRVNGEEHLSGMQYDKYGKKVTSQVKFAGEIYTSQNTYDVLGRTTSLDVSNGGGTLFSQAIGYNQYSEIISLTDRTALGTSTYNYAYDEYSQLAGVSSGAYSASYEYDTFGRVTGKNEGKEVDLYYDSSFPFFAPKSVQLALDVSPSPSPQPTTAQNTPIPTNRPTVVPSGVRTDIPTNVPTDVPLSNTPVPTNSPTNVPTQVPTTAPPTITPIPTSQGCHYYAKAYVRKCENADCSKWSSLNAFDQNPQYGLANEYQRDTNGDSPVDQFNDTPGAGPGEHVYQSTAFVPPTDPEYQEQDVKIYIDEANWEIIRRESVGPGGPTQAEIDAITDDRFIGQFDVDCGTNVTYGWYVKQRGQQLTTLAEDLQRINFEYTPEGSLKGDHEACYFYNREGEMYRMKVKQNPYDACTASTQAIREIFFYHNFAGAIVLQEEYESDNLNDPVKQIFLFGAYEEIYTR